MSLLGQMVRGRKAAVMDPHGANAWNLPMPMAGVKVDDDNALTHSPFWAAVRILTSTLAGLTWHVYDRQADGGKKRDTSHPVDPVLRYRANTEIGAFAFRETMMGWALLRGNGYAEIERNGRGDPLALWPIAPTRVRPMRLEGGELVYEIDWGNNDPQYIRAADMFHLRGLGYDGLRGYAILTLARESIGSGIAIDKFAGSFFGNGSHMGGVVTHPETLSPKSEANLRAALESGHQGVGRANRILLLQEAMTWTERGVPPEDAQFLETRVFGVQEASRWFGVPPHKLADYSHAHFRNVEQSEIEYSRDGVVPWALRLEEEADFKLIGGEPGKKFTKLNVKARLRGDTAAQTMHYRQMRDLGALSINEIRELEDMNPIGPEGDLRLVPMNMQRLEDAAKPPEPPPDMTPGGPPGEAGEEQAEEGEPGKAQPDTEGVKKATARAFTDAATRVLRKEANAAKRAAMKHAGDVPGFRAWAAKFFAAHYEYVYEAMQTPGEILAELLVGQERIDEAILSLAAGQVMFYAKHHAERSEADILTAFPAGCVKEVCDGWLIDRPGEAAVWLTNHITDAVLTAMGDTDG